MTIRFAPVLFVVLIATAVVFWTQLDGLLYPAGVFPRFVLVILAGSAAISLVREFTGAATAPVAGGRFLFACGIAVSAVAYIAVIGVLGFYVASAAYLMILYPLVNRVKDGRPLSLRLILNALAATVLVVGALYVVFTVLLRINVPMLVPNVL